MENYWIKTKVSSPLGIKNHTVHIKYDGIIYYWFSHFIHSPVSLDVFILA